MWTATRKEKTGIAICRYDGMIRHGLSLLIGDIVLIKEQCAGWYRGCTIKNLSVMGIFPANYVNLKECSDDGSPLNEDPIVTEVKSALKEWNTLWKELFMDQNTMLFQMINVISLELIAMCRQLLSGTLTVDSTREMKAKITTKLDWGNKMLGLDLVPRVNSEPVDVSKTNPLQLFMFHQQSSNTTRQTVQSQSSVKHDTAPVASQCDYNVYQLLTAVNSFDSVAMVEYEIHLRLFDSRLACWLSESFITNSTKLMRGAGAIERATNVLVIFTDILETDLDSELYLVAQVYKIGGLKDESSGSKTPVAQYRRPYGCGVHRINEVFNVNNDECQINVKVLTCNESEFAIFHDTLLRKLSGAVKSASSSSVIGLFLSLRVFKCSIAEMIDIDPRLAKNSVLANRMGLPDVIMPDMLRNDLFVTVVKAELDKCSKSTPKNVELRVSLVTAEGKELPGCIYRGSGQPPVTEHKTAVLYHNNSPLYNEVIRLAIPTDQFYDLHLRIEFRHCSRKDRTEKKLFGFAFVLLSSSDGTILMDGSHELTVFKCEDVRKLHASPPFYLTFLQNQGQSATVDTVCIDTMLCSTKLTQNADLLSLLKWRAEPQKVHAYLDKLAKLDGKEIMKFLQDILDALFGMMSSEISNQQYILALTFRALVHVLNLVEESKFIQFRKVIDSYIENSFSALLVHKQLMSCLCDTLDDVMSSTEAPSTQDNFQKIFNVLDNLGKFIVYSRKLHCQANRSSNPEEFLMQVNSVFGHMNKVIASKSDGILQTQIALIRHAPAFWMHMTELISPSEICQVIYNFITSLPKSVHPDLNHVMLWCLKTVVRSTLFQSIDAKEKLIQLCMGQLKRHLSKMTDLKRCSTILTDVLSSLYNDQQLGIARETHVQIILDGLLDVMIQTVLTIDKTNQWIGRLVVCTLAMLKLMDEHRYQRVVHLYNDRLLLCEFLLRLLTMSGELVELDMFAKDWVVMKLCCSHIVFSSVQLVSTTISSQYLTGANFDLKLWHAYFSFVVKFITQPCLQLEQFSMNKQQKITKQYGDMRLQAGHHLVTMWKKLGDNTKHFLPAFVGLFLDVTIVPMTELRRLTLPIFYDLMEVEQRKSGCLDVVENEIIDKLDLLISDGKGDYEYRELFSSILLEKLETAGDWRSAGVDFVHSLAKLMERLLDYRHVFTSEESHEKRMICVVNLLNYYQTEVSRVAMYVRYIYKLYEMHLAAGNHTEAALTLQLHAELLDWSDQPLPASLKDSRSSPALKWQGKEAIYLKIIQEFDLGKSWEFGLPLCEELATMYKSKFLYQKLSVILKTQSEFYNKILHDLRPPPEYFRVGLYGQKFPLFLRNKEFVYRAKEFERLDTFQWHLLSEFSEAIILHTNSPPDDDIKLSQAEYLQICYVRPVADIDQKLTADGIPSAVSAFYRVNNVSKFQYDRPFYVGDKSESEVKTMHIERTTLELISPLPGILRWFPIASRDTVTLSPLEVAVDTMQTKNMQLTAVIANYDDPLVGLNTNINPLTMSLNGVVDAAVMGGIAKYQEAFLTDEFLQLHPENGVLVEQLKELIKEQMHILKSGLKVHKRLAPADIQPLHKRMEEMYVKMMSSLGLKMPPSRNSTDSGEELPSAGSRLSTASSSDGRSQSVFFDNVDVIQHPQTPGVGRVGPTFPSLESPLTGIKKSRISIPGVFAKFTENAPAPTRWYTDTTNKNAADTRTPPNQTLSPGNNSPVSSPLELRRFTERKGSLPMISTPIVSSPKALAGGSTVATRQPKGDDAASEQSNSKQQLKQEHTEDGSSHALRRVSGQQPADGGTGGTLQRNKLGSDSHLSSSRISVPSSGLAVPCIDSSTPSLPPKRSQSTKETTSAYMRQMRVREKSPLLTSVPDEDDGLSFVADAKTSSEGKQARQEAAKSTSDGVGGNQSIAAASKRRLIVLDSTLSTVVRTCSAVVKSDDVLKIAKQLEKMGVDVIEAGSPAASRSEFEIVQQIASAVQNSVVCAVASTTEGDVRLAGDAIKLAKRKRIRVVIATSKLLMDQHELKMTSDVAIKAVANAVKLAVGYTNDVQLSAEDVFQSDLDFLCRVYEAAISAGATTVGLCDASGNPTPGQWDHLLSRLMTALTHGDKVTWSVRCRNDLGLAVANALSSIARGATQVECAVNGLGNQVGVASLEEVVSAAYLHGDQYSCTVAVDRGQLVPASRLVAELTGIPVSANKPIVGANVLAHNLPELQQTNRSEQPATRIVPPEGGDKSLQGLPSETTHAARPSELPGRPDNVVKRRGSESAPGSPAAAGSSCNGERFGEPKTPVAGAEKASVGGVFMQQSAAVASQKLVLGEHQSKPPTAPAKPAIPSRANVKIKTVFLDSPTSPGFAATGGSLSTELPEEVEPVPAIPDRLPPLLPDKRETVPDVPNDAPPVPLRGKLTIPAVYQNNSQPTNAQESVRLSTRPAIPPRKT